jgi:putative transposase
VPTIQRSRRATTHGTDQRDLLTLRRQVERLARENEQHRRQLQVLLQLIVVLRAGTEFKTRARLVQEHRGLGISWLCRVLGVERRRLYRWRSEEPAGRAVADEQLAAAIARVHAESGGAYGAARVTMALRREGLVVNRKRAARIMRERGIRGVTRRRRRSLTRPDGKAPPAPDLPRRDFTAPVPGSRLVGDITCLPTGEGRAYLAVLPDLCTREITGWAIAARRSATLVVTTLRTAFHTGRLSTDGIVHTDRGAGEYTSAIHRRELARTGARQSLSRSGSCLDNAPAESFFATPKSEIGQRF